MFPRVSCNSFLLRCSLCHVVLRDVLKWNPLQVRVTFSPLKTTVQGGWREITDLGGASEEEREKESEVEMPVVPPTVVCVGQTRKCGSGEPLGKPWLLKAACQPERSSYPGDGDCSGDGSEQNYFNKAVPAGFTSTVHGKKWLGGLLRNWISAKVIPCPGHLTMLITHKNFPRSC